MEGENVMQRYDGIKRAALEIAYDNGGINRGRSQKKMMGELDRFVSRQPFDILQPIDTWLSGLSGEDIQTVCCGEDGEREAILTSAPPFTDQLLNDYFNEVC